MTTERAGAVLDEDHTTPDPNGSGAAPKVRGGTGPSPLMAAPALVLFGIFALVPLVGVVVLSLMKWDGIGDPAWTGLDNWFTTLSDPETVHAIWLSVQVMVFSWLF